VFGRAGAVNRVADTDEGWRCSRCSVRNSPSSAAQSCASCGQGESRATTALCQPPPNNPAARARVAPSAWPQAHGQQQLSVGYFQPSHGEIADGRQSSTCAYFNPAVPPAPMVRLLPFGVGRRYHTIPLHSRPVPDSLHSCRALKCDGHRVVASGGRAARRLTAQLG
jgi:ribosomal protein L37E